MEGPASYPASGADVAVSITRQVTHQRIGMRLDFEGARLDPVRLRQAVLLSLEAQPSLACSFTVQGRHAQWTRLESPSPPACFEAIDTEHVAQAMSAFQATEVPDVGPQVGVALFRASDGDHLGIKVSHILADGQSAKRYAYLLADIYTHLAEDPSWHPVPDIRPRATAVNVWNALTAPQRKAAKKAKSWTNPTWQFPIKGRSGLGLTYRAAFLEPEEFLAMKGYGRLRVATVNQMLLAAVFRTCVEMFSPPRNVALSLMCTADLRRYLADPIALPPSMVSISGSLDLKCVDGESFDATLYRVQERMKVWDEQCYGAAPAFAAERMSRLGYALTERLLKAAFKMGGRSGKSYPWFTNIGVIDDDALGFAGVAPTGAYMFGPSPRGAGIVPVISTYRNRLAICMGYCEADIEASVIEQFLKSVVSELALATAAGSAGKAAM